MPGFWDLPTPDELPEAILGDRIGEFRHTITHHHYTWEVRHASATPPSNPAFRWFTVAQLATVPFSTTARKALKIAGFVHNL
jgi:adenine-specific DNA glycosylase